MDGRNSGSPNEKKYKLELAMLNPGDIAKVAC
jgi:hypothetical protein